VEALWLNAFFLHVLILHFHQTHSRDFEGVQTSPCEFVKKWVYIFNLISCIEESCEFDNHACMHLVGLVTLSKECFGCILIFSNTNKCSFIMFLIKINKIIALKINSLFEIYPEINDFFAIQDSIRRCSLYSTVSCWYSFWGIGDYWSSSVQRFSIYGQY